MLATRHLTCSCGHDIRVAGPVELLISCELVACRRGGGLSLSSDVGIAWDVSKMDRASRKMSQISGLGVCPSLKFDSFSHEINLYR